MLLPYVHRTGKTDLIITENYGPIYNFKIYENLQKTYRITTVFMHPWFIRPVRNVFDVGRYIRVRGQVGGGWALEMESFWVVWNGIEPIGECHLGPKKLELLAGFNLWISFKKCKKLCLKTKHFRTNSDKYPNQVLSSGTTFRPIQYNDRT